MMRLFDATGLVAALIMSALYPSAVEAHDLPGGPLPIGDGRLSGSPLAGSVFACQTAFRGGPGLQRSGNWINGKTWDPAKKPSVSGAVTWPASVTIALEGDRRVIRANGLPKHPTGTFPIARSDQVFQYDPNPNSISAQDVLLILPGTPALASDASCVPMGPIGFALTGAYIYNALDAMGRDAAAYEMQDSCNGHPERKGQYHYHNWSPCIPDKGADAGRHSDLVGFALDGFGLFGPRGDNGRMLANADLDECHGHTHEIEWNGRRTTLYHYHFTREYPYTIGCFRGIPVGLSANGSQGPGGNGKKGGPTGQGPAQGKGGPAALQIAARELGIDVDTLRRALGPPPADFTRASSTLGIPETRLRDVMRRARGG